MLKFSEANLIYEIPRCKSTENYLIDDFYYNIVTESEARIKKLDLSMYKSINLHGLALRYANKFAELTNNKELQEALKHEKFEDFYDALIKNEKVAFKFHEYLDQDRVFAYEFCKENKLPILLDTKFLENFSNKVTSFNNLLMHVTALTKLYNWKEVSIESDIVLFDNYEFILDALYNDKSFAEFLFLYNIVVEHSGINSWLYVKYNSLANLAFFETRKDRLLDPAKRNKREFLLYVFGFDKNILTMVNAEYKNEFRDLRFEATDNPYGYAFGIIIKPSRFYKSFEEFTEFIKSQAEFFKRMRERTKNPLYIELMIKTNFYPQNDIEDINLDPELLKVYGDLGVKIQVFTELGD